MSLAELSATELLSRLRNGEVSSCDVVQAHLDRISQVDGQVKAYLNVDVQSALRQAEKIDKKLARKEPVGALAGLPVSIKDNICAVDSTTSCASRMLEGFRPPYNATVIDRLVEADAVLMGRTNMDEFAMGGSTETSAFHPTGNPWDLARTPGGSSGGAAACVAAMMAPLSVGSDTGGSIRQPASFCGVVGLKPTYGRVSRNGLVAFASSLDQIGPLARSAEDAALLLEVLAGPDPRDETCLSDEVPSYSELIQRPLDKLRIGIVREHYAEGLDGEVATAVRGAIQELEKQGATVEEISLPRSKYAVATYYVIAPCEASSNLARYDGVHYGHRTDASLSEVTSENSGDDADSPLIRMYTKSRSEAFGSEVKRRIMIGTYALSAGYYDAYYLKALKVRRLIREDLDAAFKNVDIVAGPVTPQPAFPLGSFAGDPLSLYLVDLYTVSANLAGVPAISIPCGFSSERLPIGLQLIAPPLREDILLQASHAYQQVTNWHNERPSLSPNSAG